MLEISITNKELYCRRCHKEFIWSVGEIEFMFKLFQDNKITAIVPPSFCGDCRMIRKQMIADKDKEGLKEFHQ